MTVRVRLATHLRAPVDLDGEVAVDVPAPVTQRSLIDALDHLHPAVRGTVRDPATRRRPLVRFLDCGEDLSHHDLDAPLPPAVAAGREPFVVLCAIAGG